MHPCRRNYRIFPGQLQIFLPSIQVEKFRVFNQSFKKAMSTVAREILGSNVEEINLLKTLNLISGKGVVG